MAAPLISSLNKERRFSHASHSLNYSLAQVQGSSLRWLMSLLLVLLLSAVQTCADLNNIHTDIVSSESKQNVSCIAHDAKFTCDCRNVNQHLQLPPLAGTAFQVEIGNCKLLTVDANTLEAIIGLRKVSFKNIDNLVLNKYALSYPRYASNTPLIVEFERVNFELIDSHAIIGNIEEISFMGGRIDVMRPFAFSTLGGRSNLLKIDHVLIKRMETQAFKKFDIADIDITNCVFESSVPSKAFYEVEVHNRFCMHNVQFQEIHSHAFSFKLIKKLIITNNHFKAVDGEWIEAFVRDSPLIHENQFGLVSPIAFQAIRIHRDYTQSERLELHFFNNSLHFPNDPLPLEFNPQFVLNLRQLHYENTFSCNAVDMVAKPPQAKHAFFRSNSDNIYFHSTRSANANNNNRESFMALNKIIESDCHKRSYLLYIILGVVALVVLIVVIVIIVWIQVAKKRKRQKMDIVTPEPRTYRETQIVYQIENAGLLKTDL